LAIEIASELRFNLPDRRHTVADRLICILILIEWTATVRRHPSIKFIRIEVENVSPETENQIEIEMETELK